MSAEDCEFLFDVAKVASGLPCEVREVFDKNCGLLGYRISLHSSKNTHTLEMPADLVANDRPAAEARVRKAVEKLLARVAEVPG